MAKETVIIVHGTWAAPGWAPPPRRCDLSDDRSLSASEPKQPVKRRWYELVDGRPGDEPFPAKLDAALQERGSPARCWAHCTQSNQIFHWSGDNTWIARTHAASELGDYVVKLQNEGWRCHIVAHSHGGNVLVESLPRIVAAPGLNKPLGAIVTLGCPFIDTMSPILERASRTRRFLDVASWIGFAIVTAALASLAYLLSSYLATFALILLIMLPVYQWFVRRRRARLLDNLHGTAEGPPRFFAMGSRMDEAWQILNHIRTIQNPLAVKQNLVTYLFVSLRSNLSQSAEVARIRGAKSYNDLGIVAKLVMAVVHIVTFLAPFFVFQLFLAVGFSLLLFAPDVMFSPSAAAAPELYSILGVLLALISLIVFFLLVLVPLFLTRLLAERSFYSAYLSPFRWFKQLVASLGNIFPEMATYIVRKLGWSVLQRTVLGLEGYRFTMPLIRQFPRNVPEKLVKYEAMPRVAEQRALERRSAWVARHLGDVSQTFSKLAVTTSDIKSLLYTIEEDQTLVHAAYYTDDECIALIADWIAGMDRPVPVG